MLIKKGIKDWKDRRMMLREVEMKEEECVEEKKEVEEMEEEEEKTQRQ